MRVFKAADFSELPATLAGGRRACPGYTGPLRIDLTDSTWTRRDLLHGIVQRLKETKAAERTIFATKSDRTIRHLRELSSRERVEITIDTPDSRITITPLRTALTRPPDGRFPPDYPHYPGAVVCRCGERQAVGQTRRHKPEPKGPDQEKLRLPEPAGLRGNSETDAIRNGPRAHCTLLSLLAGQVRRELARRRGHPQRGLCRYISNLLGEGSEHPPDPEELAALEVLRKAADDAGLTAAASDPKLILQLIYRKYRTDVPSLTGPR